MATIAEQLTSLANTKTAIKDAIVAKGVSVADTDPFSAYPAKISEIQGGGGATDEWQPNPNWWDIKGILDADTRDYPGKVGVILYNFNDVSDFQLNGFSLDAVATSDGAFYTYEDNGANVSHNWDTTKDKDDGRGFKTRWVIYYYKKDTTSDVFSGGGFQYNYIAYLVLRINCSSGSSFCRANYLLEGIDNVGYTIEGNSFYEFCYDCCSLQKLPDNLDTSNATNFYGFLRNCSRLQMFPDNLDTSNGTNFGNFCYNCYSLQKFPDNLDTSNGTNFNSFGYNCYSLQKLPDNLDTSNGTNFNSFCYYCRSLQMFPAITMEKNSVAIQSYSKPFSYCSWIAELPLTLPSNANFWLDSSTRISIESFRYVADHAPDVTATPRTLTIGSTNISRINAEDPTIITDLNAKGWTVA